MGIPQELSELIDRFDRNREAYRSGQYNETQVRREFIDPFFELLGWDVNNKQGYAEAYKDVIHEDAIKIGGATKAPDYCFRVGGTRKFFLEAKKPSVNIKDDISPAFQLRRYAWSAKLPLSILTDFEEFAVYDCRAKPDKADKSSTGRILYLTYADYAKRWEEIAGVFSRDAVLKGSFDKHSESTKIKRGTAEVDDAFLQEIERWRELLARNLALRNQDLTQRELNFAVQNTIDRIIFLRICEDRGIEPYGQLRNTPQGAEVYEQLCKLFRRADDRYNSGLFHFKKEKNRDEPPDELSLALVIDDKPLKDILKNLYYPDSPYEFSVLPADILGQVYEQFLGKVIRLTAGHRAEIEDKPEVKKAGGVYYTPTYIVEYIVKQTLGKILEDKTPRQAAKLKILDPACGSGSFLISAYQYLLDWHRDWYIKDGPQKHTKELHQVHGGDWRLITTERKRILLNNIYGIDIDPQAVEVTKLSLLLKVLEGETEQTIFAQMKLFQERALPDLENNIKCGNSLIGPDFYDGQQLSLLGQEELYRVNVFDWRIGFPEIFDTKEDGFDVVVGNPPYVRVGNVEEAQRPYLYKTYEVNHRFDIYTAFIQRVYELLSKVGLLGFIVPNKFFTSEYGVGLRQYLSSRHAVEEIVDFGDNQVFEGATTYTCLLFLNRRAQDSVSYRTAEIDKASVVAVKPQTKVKAESLRSEPWTFLDERAIHLLTHLKTFQNLGAYCEIARGLETGSDAFFLLTSSQKVSPELIEVTSTLESEPFYLEAQIVRKVVKGAVDLRRYFIEESSRYLFFPYRHDGEQAQIIPEDTLRTSYPLAWQYLRRHANELKESKGDRWYAFRRRNYDLLDGVPRLLVPSIGKRTSFTFDTAGEYHFVGSGGGGGGGYGIELKPEVSFSPYYLLGLLNSQLLDWQVKLVNSRFGNGYYSFNKQYIEPLAVRPIDFSNQQDTARHGQMVELVQKMITLHTQLSAVKIAHDRNLVQRQIDMTDRQIDLLVYELYGLTEEEVKIVEEA